MHDLKEQLQIVEEKYLSLEIRTSSIELDKI